MRESNPTKTHAGGFVLALCQHWTELVSGGVIGAISFINQPEPLKRLWWALSVLAVILACFRAWREQCIKREKAEGELQAADGIIADLRRELHEIVSDRDALKKSLDDKAATRALREELSALWVKCRELRAKCGAPFEDPLPQGEANEWHNEVIAVLKAKMSEADVAYYLHAESGFGLIFRGTQPPEEHRKLINALAMHGQKLQEIIERLPVSVSAP